LNEIGELDLREDQFLPTSSIEFFITLSRSGSGCGLTRLQLLLQVQEELEEFPRVKDRSQSALSHSNKMLEAARVELDAARQAVASAEVRASVARAEAEAARQARSSAEANMLSAYAEAAAAKHAAAFTEARVSAMEKSTSWRVTAALRGAVRTFQR
jgi:hypothetical protein